jgi:beta-glucosidase
MALVDRAVRRILELKFRLGLFENPYVDVERAVAVSHRESHQQLALQAAREGIVLLRNQGGILPLKRKLKRIAVIGPNADNPRNQLGDYISDVILQDIVTVLDGIRSTVSPTTEVVYVKGCEVIGDRLNETDRAVAAAASADVAVIVLGENERFAPGGAGTNGEHKDSATLELTGSQEALLQAVRATGTPTVLVLINGRPLAIRWAAENIPGILEAWLPGEKGGQAVAEVLFGMTNPSGRLPVTVPRHAGQLPVYYNHKPSKAFSLRRTGYVDLSPEPLWEFGFGMSYTGFDYSDLQIDPAEFQPSSEVRVSFQVRNSGPAAGKETVQLYLRDEISSVVTPVLQLREFKRLSLEPGRSEKVEFRLDAEDFSLLDSRLSRVVETGDFTVLVGSSSRDIRLTGKVTARP